MPYKAEYIWIDGTEPTAKLRSKTKILADAADLPIWGFDGSSTNQAPGDRSDCVLQPAFSCPDPIRGGDNVLVLCEVLNTDMTPHASNTRAACAEVASKFKDQEPIFGIEQEYTFFKGGRPYGFPATGFPAPQGGYYCGVGADEVYGRDIVEAHLDACLTAGLRISGINAEVMPGQWEFQVGPVAPPQVADELWLARWLLYRIAEDFGVAATLDPKPVPGDWNGAGAHTNFSTNAMRESYDAVITAVKALEPKAENHVAGYGADIQRRLTGLHETAPWNEFSFGVSDRGASVRIPWQVEVDKKGYIEDRRPNANCDPYVVTRLIVDTCCSALAG
ncbi:MAG TPA: glutamine synthetase [Acidimicrobiales bacterium]|nr:glutamine synthetase [Acidimicrobiales bacterium]